MHFSKTYAQLLLSLPPELRDNAIQYRQLKKLINQIVNELDSLGLSPALLHELFEPDAGQAEGKGKGKAKEIDPEAPELPGDGEDASGAHHNLPRVVYEFNEDSNKIEPRLRFWVDLPEPGEVLSSRVTEVTEDEEENSPERELGEDADEEGVFEVGSLQRSLLWSLQHRASSPLEGKGSTGFPMAPSSLGNKQEVVIPLVSDTEFFQLLSTALEAVSAHMTIVHTHFSDTLRELSRTIGDSARPASATSRGVKPHSGVSSNAGIIRLPNATLAKSDLYSWREIFQLYVEAEVFESVGEATRGERTIEESEKRLQQFAERVTTRGLQRKWKLKQSRDALETFLQLNMFILNIKKFSHANSEATRKILKKHTKRTALPLPLASSSLTSSSSSPHFTLLSGLVSTSLPRVLVQAVGETLLPVIPHLDDYACLICTSIAFKPIRLNCGHLFCVRCLVKMQKRGKGNCPMCRAPSVLVANRSNVDWALLNFMQDWFPVEAKEKLKANEKEAAEEELRELGLDPNQTCVIM
ncbi:SPX domain-containing protein [Crucibulum laeve]|uniref:SPX domain-containing protein n=1 Tax=Crucibulum laeve TaxID=68775 RepID=A0A5C3LW70_9AGAR|nr:SPX domain-containing protein [Crucibulum laeve]